VTANPRNNERIIVIALTAAFCCSGLFLSAPAAQELDRLQPASSQREGYIGVESGQSALDGQYEAGVFTNFVSHPLLGYVDGEASFVIIDSLLIAHVHGAYAPVDFLRFSLDLPTYIFQTGDNEVAVGRPAGSLDGAGLGDVRLTAKGTLYDGRAAPEPPNDWTPTFRTDGIALALLATAAIPTGETEAFQSEGFRVEPQIAVDWVLDNGMGMALNLGYLIREDQILQTVEVGDQFTYDIALRSPTYNNMLRAVGSVFGAATFAGDSIGLEENPMEVLLAGQLLVDDWVINAGWGTGIIQGYGAPDVRILASAAYAPGSTFEVPDTDGDGLLSDVDPCPYDPEDFDDFQDDDGCPDLDNDADTVLDVADACPFDQEDLDGWRDDDGCPDPDNDADGFPDYEDACPDEPETVNFFQDEDGCPDEVVMVEPEEIVILEKIYFDYNSDVIQARSSELLANIAGILVDHPELMLVQVAGHTSGEGETAYNQDLSNRRARSVIRALIDLGVEESRLQAVGRGESEPIDTNDTEQGRANNRRVEFFILERGQQ